MTYYQHSIGLYADENGYSISVVRVDNKNIYLIVDEKYDKKKVSIKEIIESLEVFQKRFVIKVIYLNNLPSLLPKLSRIPKKILELNISNGIFIITSLINDKELSINENIETSLKLELNNFDKEIVNHRVYSLFLGLQEFKYTVQYLSVSSFVH